MENERVMIGRVARSRQRHHGQIATELDALAVGDRVVRRFKMRRRRRHERRPQPSCECGAPGDVIRV